MQRQVLAIRCKRKDGGFDHWHSLWLPTLDEHVRTYASRLSRAHPDMTYWVELVSVSVRAPRSPACEWQATHKDLLGSMGVQGTTGWDTWAATQGGTNV
jgi:hypothetical protein